MRLLRSILALTVVAAVTTPAAAFRMDFTGSDGYSVTPTLNGVQRSPTVAGRYHWVVVDGSGSDYQTGETLTTVCTELTATINNNEDTFTITPVEDLPNSGAMDEFRAGILSELFVNYWQSVLAANANTAAGKDTMTAFQIAVWEIVYEDYDDADNNGSLDAGENTLNVHEAAAGFGDKGFKVVVGDGPGEEAADLANQWLAMLTGGAIDDRLVGFLSDNRQDQVTMVPIPAPIGLAALGLAGVVIGRRRLSRLVDK